MSFNIDSQEDVARQLSPLIEENAEKVRLVFKYHHGKGEMTIRATDDVVCLKYKTEEHRSLYESEQLIQSAMAQMCNLSAEDLARQREKLAATIGGGKRKKKKSTKS
mmetsp:Transcript_25389/g.42814  ORF Transcript_25389/g.42814 Transcript_25389/m.42814 type:complete len:107 (-) Transcript_25389:124-444(-)|eukprot:CAMPEP_0114427802 /NCGR_PEP_ID=MMETSP0103-20121206/8565_1 /TAXON_ID=37642 ORGANISM="Paraphysomonas imperforata, Strain PA2" /NCGR_SAMPLE_ID=MMETSP0103 /ASSEMBLY_ACC=CAM_ASM_000201 /LENGTH=106 /DNA_ID=CAMNT_0001596933 /DNA_START=188 /DNA_END=508 /DNA_ORIENTATION=+